MEAIEAKVGSTTLVIEINIRAKEEGGETLPEIPKYTISNGEFLPTEEVREKRNGMKGRPAAMRGKKFPQRKCELCGKMVSSNAWKRHRRTVHNVTES